MVISKASFANEIITAQNGEEALNYFDDLKLNNLGNEISRYPQLIFLDLNMPVMGLGFWICSLNTTTLSCLRTVR
jgi:CheY-like chemotaxis protein